MQALLFETDPSAKHRQASVAFPFFAMTSLETPTPEIKPAVVVIADGKSRPQTRASQQRGKAK
jgi:hypothetical protein